MFLLKRLLWFKLIIFSFLGLYGELSSRNLYTNQFYELHPDHVIKMKHKRVNLAKSIHTRPALNRMPASEIETVIPVLNEKKEIQIHHNKIQDFKSLKKKVNKALGH